VVRNRRTRKKWTIWGLERKEKKEPRGCVVGVVKKTERGNGRRREKEPAKMKSQNPPSWFRKPGKRKRGEKKKRPGGRKPYQRHNFGKKKMCEDLGKGKGRMGPTTAGINRLPGRKNYPSKVGGGWGSRRWDDDEVRSKKSGKKRKCRCRPPRRIETKNTTRRRKR